MREFLRGLELDEETVDTIMAEYGKNVTKFKEQVEEYKDKISGYDNQIKELNSTIEKNSKDLESLQNMTNENKNLKAQLQMSGSNVRKEFSKFVTNEVMSKVDDEHDFESVLKSYKKDNPQYFGEAVTHKVQTSPNLNGGGTTAPQTTNSIMNDILRSARDE
jgi:chromosome segregation ATPase